MDDITILYTDPVYVFSNKSYSISGKTLYIKLGITFKEYAEMLNNCGAYWNTFGIPFFYTKDEVKEAYDQPKIIWEMVK